jgi:hypothetical protein
MSDMAGKAARVCGRAQRELPRYNSVPRATPGAAAPAHEFEQTKVEVERVEERGCLTRSCSPLLLWLLRCLHFQRFSLDSQLSTSPILFVTDPFLIRRSALDVRRLFEFPPLNSLSRRSLARRRINSQLSHRSSLVSRHWALLFRLPPSAFRLPLSAFQFFSFSVFQFFSFSPQHCHLWR